MMKCVFALALMLHFCYSADNSVNFNLHTEMIERLGKLNKLYKVKQLKITSVSKNALVIFFCLLILECLQRCKDHLA